jgi:hypothetical protein
MDTAPLSREDENHPRLVWHSLLDQRYLIEVQRTPSSDKPAQLVVFEDDKPLLVRPVGLAYDARFGPDVEDVALWRAMAVEFVDGL